MTSRWTICAGSLLFAALCGQVRGQSADAPDRAGPSTDVKPLVRVVYPQDEWTSPSALAVEPRSPASQMGPPDWLAPDYVAYRDPYSAAGFRVIPPYEGPRLPDGYGGDGALAYRYGLEEWSHRARFDPFYWESHGQAMRRLNREDMTRRAERLLSQSELATRAGLAALKRGDAEQAVVALTLAARLNEADPASRIHLAQARLALGHYEAAAEALRRGLQLQPKLLYADLHLSENYAQPTDLEHYHSQLKAWLAEHPAGAEVHFLLGYLEFQRGSFGSAAHVLSRVRSALPRDTLTRDLLEITGAGRGGTVAAPASVTPHGRAGPTTTAHRDADEVDGDDD